MSKISVLGPLNVDILTIGNGPADWRENLNWEAPAEISLCSAGSIGYTVQDFAILENDVKVFANLGDDDMASIIKSQLKRLDINTSMLRNVAGKKTAVGVYWLMHGDRKRPLAYMMADYLPWPNDITSDEKKNVLDCDLLHCGGYLHYSSMYFGATTKLYKEAKENNIITSLDTQFPLESISKPWISSLEDILQYTDILITDIDEAKAITGQDNIDSCISVLMDTQIKVLVLKMGVEGSYVVDKNERHYQQATIVGELVDSIGAGDAFGAAFLSQYIKGIPIKECAKFASVVAGFTVTGEGGITKMPSCKEAFEYIKKMEVKK